jgi:glucuronosyltransferase
MSFDELRNLTTYEMLKETAESGMAMTEFALGHEKLKSVIDSDEKFDLFIYDVHYSDALLGIPYVKDIPVIAFSCVGSNHLTNEMTKNPINPAYNPSILLGFGDQMTFLQRLKNSAITLAEIYHYQ